MDKYLTNRQQIIEHFARQLLLILLDGRMNYGALKTHLDLIKEFIIKQAESFAERDRRTYHAKEQSKPQDQGVVLAGLMTLSMYTHIQSQNKHDKAAGKSFERK